MTLENGLSLFSNGYIWLQEHCVHWSVMCRYSVVSHNKCIRHTDGIATSQRLWHDSLRLWGYESKIYVDCQLYKIQNGKSYNIPTPTVITALYTYNIIWNGETTSYWTFPLYAHNIYLDHSHTITFSYWTRYNQWRVYMWVCQVQLYRLDSKASLTVAVIMLGSIKRSECSPYCW